MLKKVYLLILTVFISVSMFSQSVTLTFPNGGEHFATGVEAPHNIIWTDTGLDLFNVYYSVDSGLNWINIATDISDNFLSWAPPATLSEQCLIRVTDNNEVYSDTSDNVFSIVELHNYYAEWNTNHGVFRAMLHNEIIPITTQNFINLAERNFYNNLIFHRVISGFMIQDGDPNGNGTGGPGYEFDNEISPLLTHEHPGVLAMANAGPNTNGSQYYITVASTTWLDGDYTIFGKIVDGMDVVYEISEVPTDANDKPIDDVIIYSVIISDANPQLAINYPQGGESLIEGYSEPILWNSDYVHDVKIEFSSDNGSTWETLIDSLTSDNEFFDWNVPSIYSTECLIKITDIHNDTVVAQSAPFEIRVKPVKVTRIEFFEDIEANPVNPDNFIRLGTPLRFKVRVFNDFSENLSDVGIKLVTSDANATVTIDSISVSSLNQGDEVWTTDYLEIILPENYPTSGNVPISILINSSNIDDTLWVTEMSLPILKLFNFMTVDDDNTPDSQGNGNQTLEPGETIEFLPKISNYSSDTCYQVFAKLVSEMPSINIWNNVQGIDRIVYDTTIVNNFEPLLPKSNYNQLENDFVFDYNGDDIYFTPLTVCLYGFLYGNEGVDWENDGVRTAWAIDLSLNSTYPVDIDEVVNESNLQVVDTKNKIKFSFTADLNEKFIATIFDLNGRSIYSQNIKIDNSNVYQLNNQKLQTGVYLLNLSSGNQNITSKFFVE